MSIEDSLLRTTPTAAESAPFYLLPRHQQLLDDSAISPEVAAARGYRSVTTWTAMEDLGFEPYQRQTPGLLIPVWDVYGDLATRQFRPDTPRLNGRGQPIKYETPASVRLSIDVHPLVRPNLGDPHIRLLITEGARKEDAMISAAIAASQDIACIGLLGVWGWLGKNERGGLTTLPDWREIALNDREVSIVFDNDVTVKPSVKQALRDLIAFLERRKARVSIILLPPGPTGPDGTPGKDGADDYLAAGHTLEDLFALATPVAAALIFPTGHGDPITVRCPVPPEASAAPDPAPHAEPDGEESGSVAEDVVEDGEGEPDDGPTAENSVIDLEIANYDRDAHGAIRAKIRVLRDGELIWMDHITLSRQDARRAFYRGLQRQLGAACPAEQVIEAKLIDLLDEAEARLGPGDTRTSGIQASDQKDADVFAPYRADARGLWWCRQMPGSAEVTEVLLTNFTARITLDIREDDGSSEVRRVFHVEATRNGRQRTFDLTAERFRAMSWVFAELGAQAIIFVGYGYSDHARTAIQIISGEIPEQQVYIHTGWRQIDGVWRFLHAAGAIGPDGEDQGIAVRLAPPLDRYRLPSPPQGEELRHAIRASLRVVAVGPDAVTIPLYGAIWRAVLGHVDFTIHLIGPTGVGKSTLDALFQQHFGPEMDRLNLPGSWLSTANALGAIAFLAKDVMLTVDDFAPTGTMMDVQRLHGAANQVIRSQGNHAGRQRARPDGSLQPTRHPRGLIISSGEDLPRGASLRARILTLELEREGSKALRMEEVERCQRDAGQGLYAAALAGFLQWLAQRYDAVQAMMPERFTALRKKASGSGEHRRTPEIVANLAIGWEFFLTFAVEVGALGKQEAMDLEERAWAALGEAARSQDQYQQASDPALRFVELLGAAISSGAAHVARMDGQQPGNPESARAWGWSFTPVGLAGGSWRGKGPCIGWLDGDGSLYLEPETSYAVAQQLAQRQGDSIPIAPATLHKRLHDRKLLQSTEPSRNTLTVRKMIMGQRRKVLHLSATLLGAEVDQTDQTDQRPLEPTETDSDPGSRGQFPWSVSREPNPKTDQKTDQRGAVRESGDSGGGQFGQFGQFFEQDRGRQNDTTHQGALDLTENIDPALLPSNPASGANGETCFACPGGVDGHDVDGRPVCTRHGAAA